MVRVKVNSYRSGESLKNKNIELGWGLRVKKKLFIF